MNESVKLWCFILLLPFFAALGHDFYANYLADPEKQAKLEAFQIEPESYQVSDLGYLFTTYAPDFYENARTSMGEDSWTHFVDPVLEQYTFLIALVPFALFLTWLLLAALFGWPPFSGRLGTGRKSNADDPFIRHEKAAGFKYKRR